MRCLLNIKVTVFTQNEFCLEAVLYTVLKPTAATVGNTYHNHIGRTAQFHCLYQNYPVCI